MNHTSKKAMKAYTIEVLCSTSISVDVKAADVESAMAEAEYRAGLEFMRRHLHNEFKMEDFVFEAQTP